MTPRLAIPLAALALIAGCGGDEEIRFSAEEFVAEANARGTALELGPPLATSREETEIRELALARAAGGGATHGGGSLTVTADSRAGLREYRRCEAAATLLCFRANNVVVALEGELEEQEITTIELALARIAADSAE